MFCFVTNVANGGEEPPLTMPPIDFSDRLPDSGPKPKPKTDASGTFRRVGGDEEEPLEMPKMFPEGETGD